MPQDEQLLLSKLNGAIMQPQALAAIRRVADELTLQLQSKPAAAFVRAELPLSSYDAELPTEVKSSNVYVIRPTISSGVERHPNSHQCSMALSGSGAFHLGLGEARRTNALSDDPQSGMSGRWVSIPPNTWHEAVAGAEPWTVVTFHTAADQAIINERLQKAGAA